MLKGTLDDFTLPDVFRLMSFAKKTGRVDVVRSAGQGKVFFRDGEVYYAESSLSKEPLGQKLVRARALTEGQLMKALDEQASSKKRLGAVLLASGLVTEDQIESAIRQQIEDSIFDLLRWELGEFAWEPGAALDTEVHIGVSVENLIMEASRRLDEYEVIKRKIPSGQSVLGMAATPPEGAVEINITPQEWRILVLVDGNRTVEDIAQTVGLDEFGAMRVLYGLVSAGLIELISEGAPMHATADPSAQVLEEETVAAQEPVTLSVEPEPVLTAEPEAEPVALEEPEPAAALELDAAVFQELDPVVLQEPDPVQKLEPEAVEEHSPVSFLDVGLSQIESPESETIAEEPVEQIGSFGNGTFEPSDVTDEVFAAPAEDLVMETMDLESFGIGPLESVPEAPAAPSADDAAWTDTGGIEAFDAPQPDELVTSTPESDSDPFGSDLYSEPAFTAATEEPPAPPAAPTEAEIPVSSAPGGAEPTVDRAAVARELAGLFGGDEDRPRARPSAPAPAEGGSEDTRKRVEDDDQVTKGIISRLIDGVKGL